MKEGAEKLVCAECGSDELTNSEHKAYTTDNEDGFGEDIRFCQNCHELSGFITESEYNELVDLTDVELECRDNECECPCCGSRRWEEYSYDFDGVFANERYRCSNKECNSLWGAFYKIDHIYIYEDNRKNG